MSENLLGTESAEQAASTDGAPSTSILDSITAEDLKSSPSLTKFKDTEALARSYLELEKGFSSRAKLPTAESKKEELDEFYNKLGRPVDPSKYEFKDHNLPKEMIDSFALQAHQLGLTQKQAAALVQQQVDQIKIQTDQYMKMQQAAKITLEKEWGSKYTENLTSANTIFKKYSEQYPAEAAALQRANGNNPLLIRLFAELAKSSKEPSRITDGSNPEKFVDQSINAKKQIEAIKTNRDHPLHNPGDPGYYKAMQEFRDLAKVAYGNLDDIR